MSKRLKNNVLKLFDTVEKGIEQLATAMQEDVLEILQIMQEAVITIGNTVENCVADCDEVILQLTNLAELIYELSLDENYTYPDKRYEVETSCKRTQRMVEAILPSEFEVLFLPYKASMWDALESVYFAAKEERDCKVRVMPVPWYHVSEDRTELLTEYEGEQFPKEIPITDYREYSIPDMQPDVIFIHNPYDDKNHVTSLPERYFSSELKKYTDHLVYIPYKVCGGIVKDFYCVMPGVKNAWRVFTQCEQVSQVYLKYNLPEKIVTSGSPKIDKIVQNETNKSNVPEEWKSALDGRKVFLLNTHLNNIINEADCMICGLEQVIEAFKCRENGAVIWRPHPLSMETAQAMNPDILQRYKDVIARFEELSNGVYDQTPDPHLAIALADAYIGDLSSLVIMFGVTGKSLFIRDVTIDGPTKIGFAEIIANPEKIVEASAEKKFKSAYYEDIISLEDYLDMTLQGNDILAGRRKTEFAGIVHNTDGTVGKHIWKYVKNELDKI